MIRGLRKNAQLIFRPIERYAAGVLRAQFVGVMVKLKKVPSLPAGRQRQFQVVMSADDAEALAMDLLEAAHAAKIATKKAGLN